MQMNIRENFFEMCMVEILNLITEKKLTYCQNTLKENTPINYVMIGRYCSKCPNLLIEKVLKVNVTQA